MYDDARRQDDGKKKRTNKYLIGEFSRSLHLILHKSFQNPMNQRSPWKTDVDVVIQSEAAYNGNTCATTLTTLVDMVWYGIYGHTFIPVGSTHLLSHPYGMSYSLLPVDMPIPNPFTRGPRSFQCWSTKMGAPNSNFSSKVIEKYIKS
jgi:hypothetical protein